MPPMHTTYLPLLSLLAPHTGSYHPVLRSSSWQRSVGQNPHASCLQGLGAMGRLQTSPGYAEHCYLECSTW